MNKNLHFPKYKNFSLCDLSGSYGQVVRSIIGQGIKLRVRRTSWLRSHWKTEANVHGTWSGWDIAKYL